MRYIAPPTPLLLLGYTPLELPELKRPIEDFSYFYVAMGDVQHRIIGIHRVADGATTVATYYDDMDHMLNPICWALNEQCYLTQRLLGIRISGLLDHMMNFHERYSP